MKVALTVGFWMALIFISPVAINAQRLGFSIGMQASQLRPDSIISTHRVPFSCHLAE